MEDCRPTIEIGPEQMRDYSHCPLLYLYRWVYKVLEDEAVAQEEHIKTFIKALSYRIMQGGRIPLYEISRIWRKQAPESNVSMQLAMEDLALNIAHAWQRELAGKNLVAVDLPWRQDIERNDARFKIGGVVDVIAVESGAQTTVHLYLLSTLAWVRRNISSSGDPIIAFTRYGYLRTVKDRIIGLGVKVKTVEFSVKSGQSVVHDVDAVSSGWAVRSATRIARAMKDGLFWSRRGAHCDNCPARFFCTEKHLGNTYIARPSRVRREVLGEPAPVPGV